MPRINKNLLIKTTLSMYASKKALPVGWHWMTIFTPAYQREATMERLYNSLLKLTTVNRGGKTIDFEWLIVNDGSTDRTEEMVKKWCEENKLPIRYYYQENQGKHVATNFAVSHCDSEVFLSADSDDTLLPDALVIFYDEWQKIPNKDEYKGINGRTVDPTTGKVNGGKLPKSPFDTNSIDLRLKHHIKGEMCGFNRTDLMKQYPFPTPDPRMRFCPENIVWFEMSKKYKERLVDKPVRVYYHDTANAITGKSNSRSIANYYLWQYMVNNTLKYLIYSPKDVLKPCVGISMDGFKTGRSISTILNDVKPLFGKMLVLVFMPLGYVLSKR